MPSNRKLMWIVRLVFYPVSIGLIVLAWHQRGGGDAPGANDDPLAGRTVARLAAPRVSMTLTGWTAEGNPMRFELQDGRPVRWGVSDVPLRCVSREGRPELRFTYSQLIHRPQDVVTEHRRLRTRRVAVHATWENSWTGKARVRTDARMLANGLRGTLWVTVRMNPPVREPVCRSGPVAFSVTRTGGPR